MSGEVCSICGWHVQDDKALDKAWKKESTEAGEGVGHTLYQLFRKRQRCTFASIFHICIHIPDCAHAVVQQCKATDLSETTAATHGPCLALNVQSKTQTGKRIIGHVVCECFSAVRRISGFNASHGFRVPRIPGLEVLSLCQWVLLAACVSLILERAAHQQCVSITVADRHAGAVCLSAHPTVLPARPSVPFVLHCMQSQRPWLPVKVLLLDPQLRHLINIYAQP